MVVSLIGGACVDFSQLESVDSDQPSRHNVEH
jgi:hypothetical protein